jgi:CYTH domain-containing protein
MYLTSDEFRALAQLPAGEPAKTRYSVPPFGIDVFEGRLDWLLLTEAELDSEAAASA